LAILCKYLLVINDITLTSFFDFILRIEGFYAFIYKRGKDKYDRTLNKVFNLLENTNFVETFRRKNSDYE